MMPYKLVSFIVPLYNHLEQTKAMYESLLMTLPSNLNYEVIFIDDFSSDGTREWLATIGSLKVNYILNDENYGYAKTNNIAANSSKGELLFFLNNDLVFKDNWIEPMIELIEDPYLRAGIVGNVQFRVDNNQIDHAGVVLTEKGKIEHKKSKSDYSKLYESVFAVTGACFLIKKNDYLDIGGFDESFINGGEDIDLCLSIKKLGKKVYVCTKSNVYHHVSLSRDLANIQNEKNSRTLFSKWRKEIKSELAKNWYALLGKTSSLEPYLDGELLTDSPGSLTNSSRIISENILAAEESRWQRIIDGVDSESNLAEKVRFRGMTYIEVDEGYSVDADIEVLLIDTKSIVNFYVCGRKKNTALNECFAIEIVINGIQSKTFYLSDDLNINVGIVNPILIGGITNPIKIKFKLVDKRNMKLLGEANQQVIISHFVINDQVIS
jgi:GT2 family glycosyltransferase